MTKRKLIAHLKNSSKRHFSYSETLSNAVNSFIETSVNEIPHSELPVGIETEELSTSSPEELFNLVCDHCGVAQSLVRSKRRNRNLCEVRQLYCLIAEQVFGGTYTLRQIGDVIGSRDHTTVIHSKQKARDLLDSRDQKFCSMYESILPRFREN